MLLRMNRPLAAIAATVLGTMLLTAPAEARRVSIDDTLIPDFLFSFTPATNCVGDALCLSSTLPYSVDLGGGQFSDSIFINGDGVIAFGAVVDGYGSLDELHDAGVDFAAPVYASDYAANLARFHVTTQQDIRDNAAFKLSVCENFGADQVDFICTDTVDEFIAANNYNRYLGDVVIQAGAGFVVMRRSPGAQTGVATLYSDNDALEFGFGITSFETDFNFEGQRNSGSDSFTFSIQSGVPEPETWSMLILGFGLLGSALRRSRRKEQFSYT